MVHHITDRSEFYADKSPEENDVSYMLRKTKEFRSLIDSIDLTRSDFSTEDLRLMDLEGEDKFVDLDEDVLTLLEMRPDLSLFEDKHNYQKWIGQTYGEGDTSYQVFVELDGSQEVFFDGEVMASDVVIVTTKDRPVSLGKLLHPDIGKRLGKPGKGYRFVYQFESLDADMSGNRSDDGSDRDKFSAFHGEDSTKLRELSNPRNILIDVHEIGHSWFIGSGYDSDRNKADKSGIPVTDSDTGNPNWEELTFRAQTYSWSERGANAVGDILAGKLVEAGVQLPIDENSQNTREFREYALQTYDALFAAQIVKVADEKGIDPRQYFAARVNRTEAGIMQIREKAKIAEVTREFVEGYVLKLETVYPAHTGEGRNIWLRPERGKYQTTTISIGVGEKVQIVDSEERLGLDIYKSNTKYSILFYGFGGIQIVVSEPDLRIQNEWNKKEVFTFEPGVFSKDLPGQSAKLTALLAEMFDEDWLIPEPTRAKEFQSSVLKMSRNFQALVSELDERKNPEGFSMNNTKFMVNYKPHNPGGVEENVRFDFYSRNGERQLARLTTSTQGIDLVVESVSKLIQGYRLSEEDTQELAELFPGDQYKFSPRLHQMTEIEYELEERRLAFLMNRLTQIIKENLSELMVDADWF